MMWYDLAKDGKTPFLMPDGEPPDLKGRSRVARDVLPNGKVVSTVFLGLDHSFGDGPPVLFECYVFPSEDSFGEIDGVRLCTWDDAEAAHIQMVEKHRTCVKSEDCDMETHGADE